MPLSTRKNKLSVFELTLFGVYGSIMFLTKFVMQWIPNVHLLGLFIAVFTLVYRSKALIPLYVYVMLDGVVSGFSMWWIPYMYIWLPLWGAFMLVGRIRLPVKAQIPLYMVLCGLHGLAFGTLYAPLQALMFGLNFEATIAWIVAGLPFDLIHCISNTVAATLILPLYHLLKKIPHDPHQSASFTRRP